MKTGKVFFLALLVFTLAASAAWAQSGGCWDEKSLGAVRHDGSLAVVFQNNSDYYVIVGNNVISPHNVAVAGFSREGEYTVFARAYEANKNFVGQKSFSFSVRTNRTRNIVLPDGNTVVVSDTVTFSNGGWSREYASSRNSSNRNRPMDIQVSGHNGQDFRIGLGGFNRLLDLAIRGGGGRGFNIRF